MSQADRPGTWAIGRRVWQEIRPFRWLLLGLFALNLLATPVALLTPLPLRLAVDSVVGGQPLPPGMRWLAPGALGQGDGLALLVGVLLLAVAVLSVVQRAAVWLLREYVGQRIVLAFRARLFSHVQRLSVTYHDSEGSTQATYAIQYDAPALQWLTLDGLIPQLSALVTLVSMIAVTAAVSRSLALVALAVSPVIALLTWRYSDRLRSQWRDLKRVESSALGVIQEVLSCLRVVQAFGQEQREHDRFVDQSWRGLRQRLRVSFSESCFTSLMALTTAVGTALTLYLGLREVRAGALTTGELLLVMGYLAQLYAPLQTLGQQVGSLQGSFASAERAFALLDRQPDVVERPDARPLERARGEFTLRGVRFAYRADRPVLRDVDLDIPAGARVGIAGRTGAGKTTLVSLLARLQDPTGGELRLDGIDLRDYRLADLRRQFAMVLQEPVLFSTSIAENIAYARPDATREEIVAAARAANADEFIRALPDGYDTTVGERGMSLSGGERQRISLARAFLKDAPVLILDEPTSSVDHQTERLIMEAMERLMSGRTTIMIAHRLTTLAGCDLRLEVVDGRVTPREPAPMRLAGAGGE